MGNLEGEKRAAIFTGPRKLPRARIPDIKRKLCAALEQLIAQGVFYFCCDGTPGFDELAGLTVLEVRERHPQINLVMIHPNRKSPTRWMAVNTSTYDHLMSAADSILYVADSHESVNGAARMIFLAKQGRHCIAYQTHKTGDTAAVMSLAQKNGTTVIDLAESGR